MMQIFIIPFQKIFFGNDETNRIFFLKKILKNGGNLRY